MTPQYILIQLIGLCGTTLFFCSYQFKKNKHLFRIQFVSYVIYTVHFILLGAVTGGLSYLINGFRSLLLGSKWKFGNSIYMCIILCVLQITILPLTWAGWISILPVVANIAATIGGYSHNARTIRVVNMGVNSPLWLIYNIIVFSWAGILDEFITVTSILISIKRFGWKSLNEIRE